VTLSAHDSIESLGLREAELIAARRSNLAALRERGSDPFRMTRWEVDTHAAQALVRFGSMRAEDPPSVESATLAGRIMSSRKMGKNVFFADLWDRSGKIQIYVRKDAVGDEAFEQFDFLDLGDIVGVAGHMFRTKSGELTLRVSTFAVLAKDLQPLPDKHHGLLDVEKRYRRRYVDLIMNERVRSVFITRSNVVAAMRRFCDERGFLECETPTMVYSASGAAARPFRTHHNALDLELDLRIATELNLKRLIVGGLERVYEIGRIFRNEGVDTKHNPEFTMLELYAAYWSRAEMMRFNEELFAYLAHEIHGGDNVVYGDLSLSFKRPFARIAYLDALRTYGGLERTELLSFAGAKEICKRLGITEATSHGHALDKIFERIVEPRLAQPTFVHDYPVIISPLAKRMADDPELTDRYELFCAHMEMSNAFTELNDPDDQRVRFEAQIAERAAGDDEIPPPDWDFVNALEYGMPPTAGIGVGVDRLVMLLTNNQSIREVILFPLQRPQAG
jgi:lysyl-tRNA synthetase class 2